MKKAANGDSVKVTYVGTLADGTVFDSSPEGEYLECTLGENQLIVGFEDALIGMEEGEKKNVTVAAADAYGERDENGVISVPRETLPEEIEPQAGQRLRVQTTDGSAMLLTIKEVSDEMVVLDANHPLAGLDLSFEITMEEIVVVEG